MMILYGRGFRPVSEIVIREHVQLSREPGSRCEMYAWAQTEQGMALFG